MAFDEVQFPPGVSRGSTFGPGFSTVISELPDSGAENSVSRWDGAKRRGQVSLRVQDVDSIATVLNFVHARAGAARGFRWKDWSDFSTASDHRSAPAFDDVVIGTGDGSTTTFQLRKIYTSGGRSVTRLIEKPVTGSTVVGVAGSPSASGWTVNTTTGVITFSVAPSAGQEITAGCEFDVPVRFSKGVDDWFQINVNDFSNDECPTLEVVELPNVTAIDDEFYYGGSTTYDPYEDDISITVLNGRTIVLNPSKAGLNLALPDPANLSPGGPYFFIVNQSTVDTVSINDNAANLVATLGTSSSVEIILGLNAMSAKTWYAV